MTTTISADQLTEYALKNQRLTQPASHVYIRHIGENWMHGSIGLVLRSIRSARNDSGFHHVFVAYLRPGGNKVNLQGCGGSRVVVVDRADYLEEAVVIEQWMAGRVGVR